VVASAAIIVNLVIGLWLHKGSKDDLNIRALTGCSAIGR
jgi:Co/Zn/Cd efflux system component